MPEIEEMLQHLPFSLEAEQSVLGGLLLEPECISAVLEWLTKPDMFYKRQHRELFTVLVNMFNLSKTVDMVTVLDEVGRAGVFETPESAKTYLVALMELVPTTANITNYCQIVQEKYYIRTLMLACNEIVERAAQGDTEAQPLLELAEQRIFDIRQGKQINGLQRIDTVIIQAYDRLFKLTGEDSDDYKGLRSGFSRLDTLMGGLNRTDLILVAGRPGMGKSSFALNIAVNVARRYRDKSVAFFSLEMSNEQLVLRALAAEAKIHNEKLRTGRLSPDEWVGLAAMSDILSKTNLYFDDTAGITAPEIKAKVMRLKNIGLIVIDYLQLMSTGDKRSDNRVQEISKITRAMKIMAKELNAPVMLLSQLSRAAEQRQDHRPMLSDLRDSGSIEQDADIVLFLARNSYYEEDVDDRTEAQCIVAKNRHGSTGDVDVRWLGEFTRYEDIEFHRE